MIKFLYSYVYVFSPANVDDIFHVKRIILRNKFFVILTEMNNITSVNLDVLFHM